MAPLAGHDKFAQRFAGARSRFAILVRLRQRERISGIPDGQSGDGVPSLGNAEHLASFRGVESNLRILTRCWIGSRMRLSFHG